MYFVFLVAAVIASCGARPSEDSSWESYKLKYHKVYESDEEEVARYGTWKRKVQHMYAHNSVYTNTYKIGLNQFSDMSDEEFAKQMLGGLRVPHNTTTTSTRVFDARGRNVDAEVNWVEKGYVTPIKNQGHCGSCYAFAATGSLEGQWFVKSGKLPSLSEQQIVDCSRRYGNQGCNGGWYTAGWEYIRDAGGSDSEDSYPYRGKQQRCRFSRDGVIAEDHGSTEVRADDENALKEAIATVGPVAVAIEVSGNFGGYSHGVYYNSRCHNDMWHLNHAVLAVGYGTEDGQDYWLVKNSWGASWGDHGYIKMARNRGNNCGIACKAAYPTV